MSFTRKDRVAFLVYRYEGSKSHSNQVLHCQESQSSTFVSDGRDVAVGVYNVENVPGGEVLYADA